jgi:hypothetical protein
LFAIMRSIEGIGFVHRGSCPIVLSTHVSKATPIVRLCVIPVWLAQPLMLFAMAIRRSVAVSSPCQFGAWGCGAWGCGQCAVPAHTPENPFTFPEHVSPAQHAGSASAQFSPTLGSCPPMPSLHGSHVEVPVPTHDVAHEAGTLKSAKSDMVVPMLRHSRGCWVWAAACIRETASAVSDAHRVKPQGGVDWPIIAGIGCTTFDVIGITLGSTLQAKRCCPGTLQYAPGEVQASMLPRPHPTLGGKMLHAARAHVRRNSGTRRTTAPPSRSFRCRTFGCPLDMFFSLRAR